MALIRCWVAQSPFTGVPENSIPTPRDGEIVEADVVKYHLDVGAVSSEEMRLIGLRHIWVENDECQWTTEIVGNKSTEFWVSIRVYCESLVPVLELPRARKPHIIKKIITEMGAGLDAGLQVSDKPIFLMSEEVDKAARLISGRFGNRLPVVYVSADRSGYPVIDCDKLSKLLSGLAHVVVEPNRSFSIRLMDAVDRRNAYGGAVGVYWPDGVGRQLRFFRRRYGSSSDMSQDIVEQIEQAITNRRPTLSCTWAFLRESISRRAIADLKATGSIAVEKYVTAFDNELSAKNQQLETAETEITRLRAEIMRLEAVSKIDDPSPLADGKERDLYPSERRAFLVRTLREALRNIPEGSRRYHVVSDIIESNNEEEVPSDVLAAQVKEVLRGYTALGKRERKALGELGFELTEEGKHVKAVFCGDARYTFALAKTPSDSRAGLNIASDINKKLFG